MSGEQGVLFEMAPVRADLMQQYNQLTDQRWNLLDELAVVEVGRIATAYALREIE